MFNLAAHRHAHACTPARSTDADKTCQGGALHAQSSWVHVVSSTFVGNRGVNGSAVLLVQPVGVAQLQGSSFSSNSPRPGARVWFAHCSHCWACRLQAAQHATLLLPWCVCAMQGLRKSSQAPPVLCLCGALGTMSCFHSRCSEAWQSRRPAARCRTKAWPCRAVPSATTPHHPQVRAATPWSA